jgi:hypothetical protein
LDSLLVNDMDLTSLQVFACHVDTGVTKNLYCTCQGLPLHQFTLRLV